MYNIYIYIYIYINLKIIKHLSDIERCFMISAEILLEIN